MPSSLNGTGVTFNDGTTLQSGNIPAANLGSGTANSNTFLRGDRTFATPPSQAPTTAQVLSAYAGAALSAVGTYAFLCEFGIVGGATVRNPGFTRAGSALRFFNAQDSNGIGNISPAVGTWRLHGHLSQGTSFAAKTSVWLRLS